MKNIKFRNFTITKREILVSIVIAALMIMFGFLISTKWSESQQESDIKYNKAIQIDNDTDLFQYGINTNVGNAFVYGELKAVDSVTYPEIGGEYMYVRKVEEHYNMHTRTVTTTDSKGKSIQEQKHIGLGIMPEKKIKVVKQLIFVELILIAVKFHFLVKTTLIH